MCPGHDEISTFSWSGLYVQRGLWQKIAGERSRINSGDYALEGSSQSCLLPTWVISFPIAPCCDTAPGPQTPHSHTEHFKEFSKHCGSGSIQRGPPPSIPLLAPSSSLPLDKDGCRPRETLRVQRPVGPGSERSRTSLLRRFSQDPDSQGAITVALPLPPCAAMTAPWGRHRPFIYAYNSLLYAGAHRRSSGSGARILASLKAS